MNPIILSDPRKSDFYTLDEFANIIASNKLYLRALIRDNPNAYPRRYQSENERSPWKFKKKEVVKWIETKRVN